MIAHVKITAVGDVDKFLNKNNLSLDKVKILHCVAKFGGYYMVFYNEDDISVTDAESETK